jgi:hypothetical protein
MPNLIVSAHGGRWSNTDQILVPRDREVIFYVADGECLSNEDGYRILGELLAGSEPSGPEVQRVVGGQPVYNYECWFAPEFAGYCGLLEVGTRCLIDPLEDTTEEYGLSLDSIFHQYPHYRVVYWVACRTVTPIEAARPRTSAGSHLTAK